MIPVNIAESLPSTCDSSSVWHGILIVKDEELAALEFQLSAKDARIFELTNLLKSEFEGHQRELARNQSEFTTMGEKYIESDHQSRLKIFEIEKLHLEKVSDLKTENLHALSVCTQISNQRISDLEFSNKAILDELNDLKEVLLSKEYSLSVANIKIGELQLPTVCEECCLKNVKIIGLTNEVQKVANELNFSQNNNFDMSQRLIELDKTIRQDSIKHEFELERLGIQFAEKERNITEKFENDLQKLQNTISISSLKNCRDMESQSVILKKTVLENFHEMNISHVIEYPEFDDKEIQSEFIDNSYLFDFAELRNELILKTNETHLLKKTLSQLKDEMDEKSKNFDLSVLEINKFHEAKYFVQQKEIEIIKSAKRPIEVVIFPVDDSSADLRMELTKRQIDIATEKNNFEILVQRYNEQARLNEIGLMIIADNDMRYRHLLMRESYNHGKEVEENYEKIEEYIAEVADLKFEIGENLNVISKNEIEIQEQQTRIEEDRIDLLRAETRSVGERKKLISNYNRKIDCQNLEITNLKIRIHNLCTQLDQEQMEFKELEETFGELSNYKSKNWEEELMKKNSEILMLESKIKEISSDWNFEKNEFARKVQIKEEGYMLLVEEVRKLKLG